MWAATRPATRELALTCANITVLGDFGTYSAQGTAAAMDTSRVVINPLIYAEVSVGYQTVEELEELLPAADYEREPLLLPGGLRLREGVRPVPARRR